MLLGIIKFAKYIGEAEATLPALSRFVIILRIMLTWWFTFGVRKMEDVAKQNTRIPNWKDDDNK